MDELKAAPRPLMLLIGSRAIIFHMPEFRAPRDWDLIGTEAEIEWLDTLLPRVANKERIREKAYFVYGRRAVEVVNSSAVPYWAKVTELFTNEPTMEDPVLGKLTVPPLGFLVLTKHCGLIYRIGHWHKNLEDLYFLRDRLPTMPPRVAALLPDAIANSRQMFAEKQAEHQGEVRPCHPSLPEPLDPKLHSELHKRFMLAESPVSLAKGAWEGFPGLPGELRRERMIDLFAEEVAVLAAEQALRLFPEEDASEPQLVRWAIRTLITSNMPEGLRYFGVNYYREIMDRVPRGWLESLYLSQP